MRQQDILAEMVQSCYNSFERFLVGFDEENRTSQAPDLPNHASWTLGHVSLIVEQVACTLDGGELSADHFMVGPDSSDPPDRYDTELVSFGSQPVDDPSSYPALSQGKLTFEIAMKRLERAIAELADSRLGETYTLGPWELTINQLIGRVTCHNMLHAGQLIDLRRAMGFDPVLA
jgi:DinB superfamily